MLKIKIIDCHDGSYFRANDISVGDIYKVKGKITLVPKEKYYRINEFHLYRDEFEIINNYELPDCNVLGEPYDKN